MRKAYHTYHNESQNTLETNFVKNLAVFAKVVSVLLPLQDLKKLKSFYYFQSVIPLPSRRETFLLGCGENSFSI